MKSSAVGFPNDKKSACTTKTKNIATMRNNSKLDCLGPVVTDEICGFIVIIICNESLQAKGPNVISSLIRNFSVLD